MGRFCAALLRPLKLFGPQQHSLKQPAVINIIITITTIIAVLLALRGRPANDTVQRLWIQRNASHGTQTDDGLSPCRPLSHTQTSRLCGTAEQIIGFCRPPCSRKTLSAVEADDAHTLAQIDTDNNSPYLIHLAAS